MQQNILMEHKSSTVPLPIQILTGGYFAVSSFLNRLTWPLVTVATLLIATSAIKWCWEQHSDTIRYCITPNLAFSGWGIDKPLPSVSRCFALCTAEGLHYYHLWFRAFTREACRLGVEWWEPREKQCVRADSTRWNVSLFIWLWVYERQYSVTDWREFLFVMQSLIIQNQTEALVLHCPGPSGGLNEPRFSIVGSLLPQTLRMEPWTCSGLSIIQVNSCDDLPLIHYFFELWMSFVLLSMVLTSIVRKNIHHWWWFTSQWLSVDHRRSVSEFERDEKIMCFYCKWQRLSNDCSSTSWRLT